MTNITNQTELKKTSSSSGDISSVIYSADNPGEIEAATFTKLVEYLTSPSSYGMVTGHQVLHPIVLLINSML